MPPAPKFRAIRVALEGVDHSVGHLVLARPDKSNAMNDDMWREIPKGLEWLEQNGGRAVRAGALTAAVPPAPPCSALLLTPSVCAMQIVLSADGRNFCAGIDLGALAGDTLQVGGGEMECQGRARRTFLAFLDELQAGMTACERCSCPVIAAVHGACFGAGVDLITACDIRYASADATFCVKEVDLAIVADMGTLARLPGIVGDGVARELALTARVIPAQEAAQLRLVTSVLPGREALLAAATAAARSLAAKSPLAVSGTKRVLLRQRGRSVEEGLRDVAMWNAAQLPGSQDLREVVAARAEGRAPRFSKL